MANRFSTNAQYHSLVRAHGVIGAIIFLFIVPTAVMIARFFRTRPGYAIKYHAQLQVLACLLLIAMFVLGYFAVGPSRSLTNPHHGIGVAIFTLFLLQIIGGRLVRNINGRSLRVMIHQWSGRAIALLGIVQVPLGLTLYGSPKSLFILYTLWMSFLFLVYFVLSFRREGYRETYLSGARSEGQSRVSASEETSDEPKKRGNMMRWLGPLAAGAGLWTLFRGRKKDRGRSRSRSRSRLRSRSRGPEVIPSRRGSASYIEDEKYSDEQPKKGGGFMKTLLGVGAALGAGKLIKNYMDRREERKRDEEYSAVSTETPRRNRLSRHNRPAASEFSEVSEQYSRRDHGRSSLLPAPAAAQAFEDRRGTSRPMTPRPSHRRTGSGYGHEESDYSSYVSPSRRRDDGHSGGGGIGKGLLTGLGIGWVAKKFADRRSKQDEDMMRDEEDRRSGAQGSRYTGDGYPSPSRRTPQRHRPAKETSASHVSETETSSQFEPRPQGAGLGGPPMPPLPAGSLPPMAPVPVPPPGLHSHSRSQSRHDVEPAMMPPMPPDPQGVLHDSGSEAYMSGSGQPRRRASSRRRRAGEEAAAAAVAAAGLLAAEEEAKRREERGHRSGPPGQPVSVKVKVHDDRDRNVTLRRLTEEEAAMARKEQRRRRGGSVSSLSGPESPSRRHYRRDTSQRRAEAAAEHMAETSSPPNPATAGSRRPKDSAYYSGQPGPSTATPLAGPIVSSVGSRESYGTWSGVSPEPAGPPVERPAGSQAADNRRRRRLERRRSGSRPTGADMFD